MLATINGNIIDLEKQLRDERAKKKREKVFESFSSFLFFFFNPFRRFNKYHDFISSLLSHDKERGDIITKLRPLENVRSSGRYVLISFRDKLLRALPSILL